MSLDLNKLEKVRECGGGMIHARCPACAEGGHDRTGEHLRIYPDGRFGCCVHPKDREHRKRIFALVGVKERGTFSVRVKGACARPPFETIASQTVTASLFSFETAGTRVKAPSEKAEGRENGPVYGQSNDFGTLGTGLFQLRACAREEVPKEIEGFQEKLKDSETPVPSVPSTSVSAIALPHFTADGTLSIPFNSPERYHWWKGGQSVADTLKEVKERMNDASDF